jgi:hypothetical protein
MVRNSKSRDEILIRGEGYNTPVLAMHLEMQIMSMSTILHS